MSLPYGNDGINIRKVTSLLLRVTLEIGVDLIWDMDKRIEVQLDGRYMNKVRIVCALFSHEYSVYINFL